MLSNLKTQAPIPGPINTHPTPFSFLTPEISETKKTRPNDCCGLAWIETSFHLASHNYFIYACHQGEKQIKKGIKPKICLNWGGQNV